MIQNGMQPTMAVQPGNGLMYSQNLVAGNANPGYVGGQPMMVQQQPSGMNIMATPGMMNNGQQIQNQPKTVQTQNDYQQTYIPGRFANSPDEIAIVEVPMNSPMAVFPKPDRSEIYVKFWTEQGVQTETFVRKEPEQPAISASESDILQALSNIMERLARVESVQQGKTTSKKTNKEGEL